METITQEKTKFNPAEHLVKLKGGEYLEVKWRLVWFRNIRPNWTIYTEALDVNENCAIFKAYIRDENGFEIATAHGSETPRDFKDYIEKAETKAIGRALCFAGFGTQFAPELNEGDRIVDAPVKRDVEHYVCQACGNVLTPHSDGKNEYGVMQISEMTKKRFGKTLCWDCAVNEKRAQEAEND